MLWVAIAIVTAGATAWLSRPLWSRAPAAAPDGDPASRIYKDQLKEVDADLARGLLNATEADAARTEIARRLLSHSAARADVPGLAALDLPAWGGAALAALAAAAAVGVYLITGSPMLPDQPFASRNDGGREQAAMIQAFEQLEDHLVDNPKDGEGWDRIAPVYLRLGRYDKAASAYEQAIAIRGESLARVSGLARAYIFHQDGVVNADALKALEAAVRLDPGNLDNRFWMAVGREQAGDVVAAIEEYKRILPQGPPTAPWRKLAEQRLAGAERRLANSGPRVGVRPQTTQAPSAPGMPQLTPEQIEAAKQMSAGDQKAMIEGMVGRLAERLKSNGQNAEDWQKLVNAYMVLGRKGDAVAALGEARRNLASDRDALGRLDELAQRLGIGS